jgi:hemerythrin-like metal-binding protein
MIPLEWTVEYSTGIPKIDSQHAYLFELANRLTRAVAGGRSQEVLSEIIRELNDYVASHFSYEESVMEQAHYAGLAVHRQMHEKMREELAQYAAQLAAGTLNAATLSKFLERWLTGHIMHEDMAYIPAVSLAQQ